MYNIHFIQRQLSALNHYYHITTKEKRGIYTTSFFKDVDIFVIVIDRKLLFLDNNLTFVIS